MKIAYVISTGQTQTVLNISIAIYIYIYLLISEVSQCMKSAFTFVAGIYSKRSLLVNVCPFFFLLQGKKVCASFPLAL